MSYIDKIFERCDIEKISSFILHGSEGIRDENRSYYQRVQEAYANLDKWLCEQYPDFNEHEKQSRCIHRIIGELESAFMEIGLQAGILLAVDFKGKIK